MPWSSWYTPGVPEKDKAIMDLTQITFYYLLQIRKFTVKETLIHKPNTAIQTWQCYIFLSFRLQ